MHNCIKCSEPYKSEDDEAYYCPSCNEERLRIAKEIDAKIKARPKRKTISGIQEYDNAPKVHGFLHVRL